MRDFDAVLYGSRKETDVRQSNGRRENSSDVSKPQPGCVCVYVAVGLNSKRRGDGRLKLWKLTERETSKSIAGFPTVGKRRLSRTDNEGEFVIRQVAEVGQERAGERKSSSVKQKTDNKLRDPIENFVSPRRSGADR